MDIPPLEFARQMTLIEYDLFSAIQPWECIKQVLIHNEINHEAESCQEIYRNCNKIEGIK